MRITHKIGRNERCHCGSGKKYKHCHLALDEQQRRVEAVEAARAEIARVGEQPEMEAPIEPAKLADMPGLLKRISQSGLASKDAKLAEALEKAKPILEYLKKQKEIDAAAEVLEAHRAEFQKLLNDTQAYMDRSSALFAEECFAPLRFTAADVRRAFDQVGEPAGAATDDRTMKILEAAILHLADKDYRTHAPTRLFLHLPAFVADGRYMDAWMIQHCAHETGEFDQDSNPFLFAMFSHGYIALSNERKAKTESMLRKFGMAPEKILGMGLAEMDAWIQAQGADPAQRAEMEAFMEQNPDLRSEAIATIEAMESESVKLLDRPDAGGLLLAPAELEAWLPRLNADLADSTANFSKKPDGTFTKENADQFLHDSLVPFLREMARAIFTPARLEQLVGEIREYRRRQIAAGDSTVARYALGAITSLERENEPGQNYFLISLCFASLKPAAGAEVEDPDETPD